MNIAYENENLIVSGIECFDLATSVDCGQAFRWNKIDANTFSSVAFEKKITVTQQDDKLIFCNMTESEFNALWKDYFDLDKDYKSIISSFSVDAHLSAAAASHYGIRILNQEPWEALCSFIISQNNNIPRIKGIISRLCEFFGDKIDEESYSFPSAETLSKLTVEDLSPIRAGFRAKYILDAAQKVANGEVNIYRLAQIPIEDARQELLKIKGVGPKVAECVLLYGCRHTSAFPLDVWMKRVLFELYSDAMPNCKEEHLGIAQQYLFHWRRNFDSSTVLTKE